MKKLPIGISSFVGQGSPFAKIRTGGYYYVENCGTPTPKTYFVKKLVEEEYYFLSRPRRLLGVPQEKACLLIHCAVHSRGQGTPQQEKKNYLKDCI